MQELRKLIPASYIPRLVVQAALGNENTHRAQVDMIPDLMQAYPDLFTIPNLMKSPSVAAFLPQPTMHTLASSLETAKKWTGEFYRFIVQHPEIPDAKYVTFLNSLLSAQYVAWHSMVPVPERLAPMLGFKLRYCRVVKDGDKP